MFGHPCLIDTSLASHIVTSQLMPWLTLCTLSITLSSFETLLRFGVNHYGVRMCTEAG